MFDHLGHLLHLLLHVELFLLLLVFLALIRSHFLQLLFLENLLLADLFDLLLLFLLVVLLCLRCRRLLAVLLRFRASLVRNLQSDHLVDDCEDGLKDLDGLGHGLFSLTNFDASAHKDWVLVVDLLVSDVEFVETVTVSLEDLANIGVDQLISDFFVLAEDDKVVFLGKLFRLLLVCGRSGDWKILCLHWEE